MGVLSPDSFEPKSIITEDRKLNKLKRYAIFTLGLFFMGFGVALAAKINLGTSPISSIPYVLSEIYSPTIGQFTIYFSLFLVVIQLIILRKKFNLEDLMQIPISIVFGYFIDFHVWWLELSGLIPDKYILRIIGVLISCVVVGTGVYIEVLAGVAMLPGECVVKAISTTWNTNFGSTKMAVDISMASGAAIIGLVIMHALVGVREGTAIAAVMVGFVAKQLTKRLKIEIK